MGCVAEHTGRWFSWSSPEKESCFKYILQMVTLLQVYLKHRMAFTNFDQLYHNLYHLEERNEILRLDMLLGKNPHQESEYFAVAHNENTRCYNLCDTAKVLLEEGVY